MSINAIYYPHRLDFNETPGVAGQVVRFDSVNAALNYEMIQRKGGADPYPCFIGAGSAEPELQFTTSSIKSVLDVCLGDIEGEYISRALSGDAAVMSYRAGKQFGTREALTDSEHIQVRFQDAMLHWTQLNARESEDVTMSAALVVARNAAGLQPYITIGDTETLNVSLCEDIYSLGPVLYNGRPLKSIHSVSWNNNTRLYSRKTSNNPQDPCWQSIHDFRPVITCGTNDLREVLYGDDTTAPYDYLIDGQQADVYGGQAMQVLEIYLRKRSRTGFYVADATAEHIKIRCLGGWKAHTEIDGMEPAEGTLEFHVSQNVSDSGVVSTDVLLQIDTTAGIPVLDGATAPVLDAIGAQAGTVDTFFSYIPDVNPSGGPATSWTAVPAPPTGLALNTTSGVISGIAGSTPETVNVTLTAINGTGNSAQAFNIGIS